MYDLKTIVRMNEDAVKKEKKKEKKILARLLVKKKIK